MAASISHPFTRISSHSDQQQHHHILEIDDDDEEDDVSPGRVIIDCGFTRPFLYLDMIWNMSFFLVSIFVLLTSIEERPSTPLRLWICGYALQCLVHVGFVWAAYQRWNRFGNGYGGIRGFGFREVFFISSVFPNSMVKKLEPIITIMSTIWWVFGLYWVVMGGQLLLQDSPRLYWLSMVFLAFDVFFLILCFAMACVILVVLFCCVPILASVAYAMSIREGASENVIGSLPKFLYRQQQDPIENDKKQDDSTALSGTYGICMTKPELVLQPEDSECCICLYKYVDGTELCKLACNHHFHHGCIAKWLRINATCPLCKFNILRGSGDILV